jgi:hypothetical protein
MNISDMSPFCVDMVLRAVCSCLFVAFILQRRELNLSGVSPRYEILHYVSFHCNLNKTSRQYAYARYVVTEHDINTKVVQFDGSVTNSEDSQKEDHVSLSLY